MNAQPTTRKEWEEDMAETADTYNATVFLGRARYAHTDDCDTLEEARDAGAALAKEHGKPEAMLYAVKNGVGAHVDNVKAAA